MHSTALTCFSLSEWIELEHFDEYESVIWSNDNCNKEKNGFHTGNISSSLTEQLVLLLLEIQNNVQEIKLLLSTNH